MVWLHLQSTHAHMHTTDTSCNQGREPGELIRTLTALISERLIEDPSSVMMRLQAKLTESGGSKITLSKSEVEAIVGCVIDVELDMRRALRRYFRLGPDEFQHALRGDPGSPPLESETSRRDSPHPR